MFFSLLFDFSEFFLELFCSKGNDELFLRFFDLSFEIALFSKPSAYYLIFNIFYSLLNDLELMILEIVKSFY
jgi:hypothetical protein